MITLGAQIVVFNKITEYSLYTLEKVDEARISLSGEFTGLFPRIPLPQPFNSIDQIFPERHNQCERC